MMEGNQKGKEIVAKLIAKEGKSATLKLPSGEVRLISKNCSAFLITGLRIYLDETKDFIFLIDLIVRYRTTFNKRVPVPATTQLQERSSTN